MDLKIILDQFKQIEADIAAGEFVKATRDFLPVVEAACDIAESVGFKAGPNDAQTKKEIEECANRCVAALAPKAAAGPQPVGKFGDGTFLKLLLDAFLKVLPLII